MKKILLLFVLATASLTAFAQLPTFGIKGGLNFANMTISAQGSSLSISTGTLTTFSVGAFADFKSSSNVSIQPGINYTGRGGSIDGDEGTNAKFKLFYLQVPVDIVYHIPVLVGHIYLGGGPYAEIGLNGTESGNDGTQTISQDVKFGNDGDFKSSGFGLNFIGGIQFKSGLLLGLNYDLGLTNMLSDASSNNGEGKFKSGVFGVSIGYSFK